MIQGEVHIKLYTKSRMVVLRRAHVLMELLFLPERTSDELDIHTWLFSIYLKMKWACLFKENNWKYLWPMIKDELSSKN